MAKSIWDKFDEAIDTSALAEDVKEAEENGSAGFREVPHGEYEVEVNKLELSESKKGDPMVKIWFKILEGEYKGSLIFMNQVVTQGFQIHIVNDILRALTKETSGLEIKFANYNQYQNLIMDVFEAIDNEYEYALNYTEGKKGFSTYEIAEVFVLE